MEKETNYVFLSYILKPETPSKRGRPSKPLLERLRVIVWSHHVMAAFGSTQAEQFEKLISKSSRTIHLSSGLWSRYLRGDVMPQGSLERHRASLVVRLDRMCHGTAEIFYHPVWELLDFHRLLGPKQLLTLYMAMNETVWTPFVYGGWDERGPPDIGAAPFWKVKRSAADLQRICSQIPGFDGLAACLIEARMGYLAQDERRFAGAIFVASSRLAKMTEAPEFQFRKLLSVLLVLERMCLRLAEQLFVFTRDLTRSEDELSRMGQSLYHGWAQRTRAHSHSLTGPAGASFAKWVDGAAKAEYFW